MSTELALVGLAIVPPVAGCAVIYGRFVRKITKQLQDSLAGATEVSFTKINFSIVHTLCYVNQIIVHCF